MQHSGIGQHGYVQQLERRHGMNPAISPAQGGAWHGIKARYIAMAAAERRRRRRPAARSSGRTSTS
jgi:hypothetical protein